jgi:hypothetical protein
MAPSLLVHVAVRSPDVWSSAPISAALRDTLSFLSDDEYEFHFYKHKSPAPMQTYLELQPDAQRANELDEVILFSGGLDALGGAVIEAIRDKRRVALVSHRANPKINSKQRRLVDNLRDICPYKPLHIPVWVQKGEALDREYTQRSRSFLYAALATVVARAFDLRRICFYENGIVSLNLPVSEQAVGARATRTTHPQVLNGFASIFRLLTEGAFEVKNPFLWSTKSEVVDLIGDHGCAELIKNSVSCTHTREMSRDFSHCGKCSQCVSRRFATLASKYAASDPADIYKVDLLTGKREANVDITLLESFIRIAGDMRGKNDEQLVAMFPEISRVLRHVNPLTADAVGQSVARMHRKHAAEVDSVLCSGLATYSAQIVRAELPETCGILLAFPEKYKTLHADTGRQVQQTTSNVQAPRDGHRGPASDSDGHCRVAELLPPDWKKDLQRALKLLASPPDGGTPVTPSKAWQRDHHIETYAEAFEAIGNQEIKKHIQRRYKLGMALLQSEANLPS